MAAAVGAAIALRMLVGGAGGPDDELQPSPCVENAAIRVTADPPAVTWPQQSVVSWAVELPTNCTAEIRFEGEPVGTSGNRAVVPPRSRSYGVSVVRGEASVVEQKYCA